MEKPSMRPARTATTLGLALGLLAFTAMHAEERTEFGRATRGEAALIGVLYDLKQTQSRQPTDVTPSTYADVIDEFLAKNWDERVLNRYYRVSRPLYTTQVFIPFMDADNAPRAFGVEKTVAPSRWVIHYKGQVSPPTDGTYRFVGTADDIMAIAINGRTVFVSHLNDTYLRRCTWRSSDYNAPRGCYRTLTNGDWFTAKKNEIVDLDIIVGERPGLAFNAFILVQAKGERYPLDSDNQPILPIFQVAPYDTPSANNVKIEPRFSKNSPIWICHQ
jgi:hypothetical protein